MKYDLESARNLWRFRALLDKHEFFYPDQITWAYESAREVGLIFSIDTFGLRSAIKILGIKNIGITNVLDARRIRALFKYYQTVIAEIDFILDLAKEKVLESKIPRS